jgi:hypothetical protein
MRKFVAALSLVAALIVGGAYVLSIAYSSPASAGCYRRAC